LPGCNQVAAAIPHAARIDRIGRSPKEDEMNGTFTKLALATVAAGLLVPSTAAGVRRDHRVDRAGTRGVDSSLQTDRAGIGGVGADAFVRAVQIHGARPQPHGAGFDWVWVYGPVSGFLATFALAGALLFSPRARHAAVHA
jgi:hypothetical protein